MPVNNNGPKSEIKGNVNHSTFISINKCMSKAQNSRVYYDMKVVQNHEFISAVSGDAIANKAYKPIKLLSHVSSLIHLLALLQVLDKQCLLLHLTERLNKYQALNKSPTINTNNDNSNNDGKASKTSIKLSVNQFKTLIV